MKKTQVQIPDYLFKQAKKFAKSREMSFAEVVRRGLEYIVSTHLVSDISNDDWSIPKIASNRFNKDLTHQQLKEVIDNEIIKQFT